MLSKSCRIKRVFNSLFFCLWRFLGILQSGTVGTMPVLLDLYFRKCWSYHLGGCLKSCTRLLVVPPWSIGLSKSKELLGSLKASKLSDRAQLSREFWLSHLKQGSSGDSHLIFLSAL